MSNDKEKSSQTQGAQAGSEGQHGKGQSNPGGFDQQSSSSMEKQQRDQQRERDLQQRRDSEGNDAD